MDPESFSRGLSLVFTLLSTNKEPLQDLLASVIDPSGEGKIEKEDFMKDDEAEEVSGGLRIGQSLLPKQMNNLGIHKRKRVKISSKEQSVRSKFRFWYSSLYSYL